MNTTKEEREWLRVNWSVGEPSFRQWVAGSDTAHEIVPRVLRDVDTLVEVLRECYTVLAEGSYHNAACVEKAAALLEPAPPEE